MFLKSRIHENYPRSQQIVPGHVVTPYLHYEGSHGLTVYKTDSELEELWEWRQKLLGLRIITDKAWRERALAPDEMHLTRNEREQKIIMEAKSQGRNIEKV